MKLSLRRFALPVAVLGTAFLCGGAHAQWSIEWIRQLLPPSNIEPGASVSATADGVYVTASYLVRKYDLDGNVLWTSPLEFQPSASGVSATADGVYVTGGSGPVFGLVKFDLNGNQLWDLGYFNEGFADAITATPGGVYVTGSAFVGKYDPGSGSQLWDHEFNSGLHVALGVTATSDGVYVAGQTSNVLPGGQAEAFVSKYDLNGNELWTRQFGASGTNACCAVGWGTAAVANGIIVLWGGCPPLLPGCGLLVSQYDSNGNLISETPLAAIQGAASVPGVPTVSAANGRIYIGGAATNPASRIGEAAFVAALAPGVPKPISHVSPLPAFETSSAFIVQWSGTDVGGPGIQVYTIYVSDNGGPFAVWLTQTAATQGTYAGSNGHTYGFYSIAQDSAGNVEPSKFTAETTTLVDTTTPVSHVSALPATETSPNFLVQWSGTDPLSGVQAYTIYISDNGGPFIAWLSRTAATQAWYPGFLGHTYGFFSQALDKAGNVENLKSSFEAMTQTPSQLAADVNGDGQINCADLELVKASFGKTTGQPGFNPAADVNKDGVVNILDLALVTQKLIPGTVCQ